MPVRRWGVWGVIAAVAVAAGGLAAGGAGILFQATFKPSGGTARTAFSKLSDTVSVKDYGATGDGTTDDTTALQAALTTGKNVVGVSGDTYLVAGGLTQSTAGQVIDFGGAIVKLKNSATSKGILRLNGAGAIVRGGEWNMNSANNLSDADSGYSTWAVLLAADNTVAEQMYIHDSYGLAIKGLAGVSHITARFNRIITTGVIDNGINAIYFDAPTGVNESYGNAVLKNYIDVSATTTASAIGVYSLSPVATGQHRCAVQNNEVIGSASATSTAVGVTVRGLDCVVTGNMLQGFTIGISVDPSQETRTLISHNQVKGANGTSALGIESNGGRNVIVGNYVDGGKVGIEGSAQNQTGATIDAVTVVGNTVKDQSVAGIFFQPVSGKTANHITISGNTITNSTATSVVGIKLTNDCKYALISNNTIDGPGGGVASSRGVYLDTVNSDVTISGNRFSNWERAVAVYNVAAVAQDRIQFVGNDVASGLGSSTGANLLNLEGSATWGTGVRVSGNTRGSSGSFVDDYIDRAGLVRFTEDTSFTTPESNVTAGVGSLYLAVANGLLYTKISGSGNTGWQGLTNRGSITLTSASPSTGTATVITGSKCVCTNQTTQANPIKCAVSGTTLTATGPNTVTDVVTYVCFI